nr:ubiquitin hydrolase [Tanacetum cinerariifolium]
MIVLLLSMASITIRKVSDSDVEEDNRSNNEFMADLNAEYHERAQLPNQKRFYNRSERVGSTRKPMDKSKETCLTSGKPVYDPEVQTKSESNSQNMAFISSAKTSNGKEEVNTASFLLPIDEDDIEEMDMKWNMALLSMRADKFWKKTGKKISIQGWDWSYMANEEEDHALVAEQEAPTKFSLMAKSSSDTEVEARLVEFKNQEIKFCEKIRGLEFKVESKDNRIERLTNDLDELKKEKEGLDSKLKGLPEFADDTIIDYSRPSPSIERNSSDLQNSDFSISENGESSESIMSKPMIKFVKSADSPTVIKTNKYETVRRPSVEYAEMYRKTSKSSNVRGNQRNWNNLKSQQLGENFLMKNKACFKCGHFDHLAYDCGVWVDQGKT